MASMRKVNGHYYARFYDRSKSPKRKTYPLKTGRQDVARRRLSELERGYRSGDFDPWSGGWKRTNATLQEALERFLEGRSHLKTRTLETYRGIIRRMIEQVPAETLTRDLRSSQIRPYVLDSSVSNATKRKRHRHLKTFFKWTVKEGLSDENPMQEVPRPSKEKKKPAYFRPEDIEKLIQVMRSHADEVCDAAGRSPDVKWLEEITRVAVGTGLRRGELINLRWRDVDLQERRIHVRHREDFSTKGNAERSIPLRGNALLTLQEMSHTRSPKRDEPVFKDQNGNAIRPDRVSSRFKTFVRKAGLDDRLHFHSLRHTTASWLTMDGVPMRVIQAILGHASIQTTEIYSHLAPETLDAAMDETFG